MMTNRFKQAEVFNSLTVETPFIARVDGWAFHTFTKDYERPFDMRMFKAMSETTAEVMNVFKPAMAAWHSDEVSFIFTKKPTEVHETGVFTRVEKIDSLVASSFASRFSLKTNKPVGFDCRLIPLKTLEDIRAYLEWRQDDSYRNFVYGWTDWMARNPLGNLKLSPAAAAKRLGGLNRQEQIALCLENGMNLDDKPLWQKRGVVFYWETYPKEGFNPLTKETVMVDRRRVKTDIEVPEFKAAEGKDFLTRVLGTHWMG